VLVDEFIPAISAVLFAAQTPEKALSKDAAPSNLPESTPRFSLN